MVEINFDNLEKRMQQFWQSEDIYKFVPDEKEVFSIDTPPPTVSGSLHIGHIFSYTQAEIVARFMRMQGKNVFYPFGFDDNGLPSERLVEKEKGIYAVSLPRNEFTALCRDTVKSYVEEFKLLWISMGFSVDWSLSYETINPEVMKLSQKAFIELAENGKAYQRETPVLWCTECKTSISQAELDTAEGKSNFNYIPFMVGKVCLPVATTRPELLYGCVTLFINPADSRYNSYIGKTASVPLYNFDIPIMADEKVEIDKGTGIVMCATFGDTTDLEWFTKYNLPYKRVIEPNGRMSEDVPEIGGLKIQEARKRIIELLLERSLILKSDAITHTVSVHERCGRPTEIIPSRQWFIDILSHKDEFLTAAEEINWRPESMKIRYKLWVENLKWDWCISRQRYFGVPFPVWYCSNCEHIIYAAENQLPINPLQTQPLEPCFCGCNEFIPEQAVMDTWATSSITPMINAQNAAARGCKIGTMSMRTQAHDIIRTWAFYSIVRSFYHSGRLPWKNIMVCGFVMAKKGEKIGKSKGNAGTTPKELIDTYSADALRYWAANAKLGSDTMFSPDELKIAVRFITKLRNAAKFTVARLEGYDGNKPKIILPVDEWLLERCKVARIKAANFLDQYESGSARHEIDEFFWKDFCDNYLELIKDRLYNPQLHGEAARQSASYGLYYGFLEIIKLYAPFVPHITEAIYQHYYRQYEGAVSLHTMCWSTKTDENKILIIGGEALKLVLFELRRYKSEHSLSHKSDIGDVTVTSPDDVIAFLQGAVEDIKSCCSARSIIIISGEKLEVTVN